MRKTTIIAFAMGFLSILPASAADIAPVYKAPPPAAPVANWTGFYLGGNLGYGWGNHEMTETVTAGPNLLIVPPGSTLYGGAQSFDIDPRGFNGGIQAGYNWQFNQSWVWGIEADIQATNMKRTADCARSCNTNTAIASGILPALFPVTFSNYTDEQKLNWFGTVRGRLGYSNGPSLFYVTGGLAYGEVERNSSVSGSSTFLGLFPLNTFSGSSSNKSVNTGWTVGGGVETALTAGWTLKVEYLYMDLGSVTDTLTTVFGSSFLPFQSGTVAANRTVTGDLTENIVRVGLNYRFGAH